MKANEPRDEEGVLDVSISLYGSRPDRTPAHRSLSGMAVLMPDRKLTAKATEVATRRREQ